MATPTAWLMNLDADLELSAPRHYRPRAELAQRIDGLITRMGTLLAPDDVVLGSAHDSPHGRAAADRPQLPPGAHVLAFCPTPHALARLAALGLELSVPTPCVEVLREANGRAFCARLGQTLPGSAYVHTMETLEDFVRHAGPHQELLLKRAFGFAGRERRRVIGGVIDASTAGFAERSFRAGEGLQVEPWLQRGRDFALHGYLSMDGRLLTGPLMRQICDPQGRWQRSALADDEPESLLRRDHRALLDQELERTARALHAIGYCGPFGIDAFEYEGAHGSVEFQPRSEINARFSMGFPRSLLERALLAFASS